jgi:predicted amidohydrolase YtcJ
MSTMSPPRPLPTAVLLSPLLAVSLACTAGPQADTVLYNAKVVTVDEEFSVAEAVAIAGDRIQDVGPTSQILRLAGRETTRIDLKGKTVLPGLIDAHLHPSGAAVSELFETIPNPRTLPELLEHIRAEARRRRKGEWIVHPRFFPTRLLEMRPPTRQDLDRVAPDHPVFLNGSYAGWINSAALRASGIDGDHRHPGVLRDPETGEPTGVIRASAFPFVEAAMPRAALSDEQELDALEDMLRRYSRVGLTGITDGAQEPSGLKPYLDLAGASRLPVRVNVTMTVPPFASRGDLLRQLGEWGLHSGFGDQMVRISQLKTKVDGGILTGTAYMREPWGSRAGDVYGLPDPQYRGVLLLDEERLRSIVSVGSELGWKMTAHVTGGGGVDLLLDAYEAADADSPIDEKRFSIIHGNFYTPDSIERCRRLGVLADLQPAWLYKDADALRHVLGPERLEDFLPVRTMLDAGMVVNAGSDHMDKWDSHSSINPYNPFLGMWILITRRTERGSVVGPSQAISREEALRLYTIDNAYGTFEEGVKGSIEVGKLADLIVISEDYLSCPVDRIRTIEVEMTMVGGKIVYSGS